jgi:hypothetical protein
MLCRCVCPVHISKKLQHSCSTPERKTPPHNHYSKSKKPNLRTELAGVIELNQVGLDKAEQLRP